MSSATLASSLRDGRTQDGLLGAMSLPFLAAVGLLLLIARRPEAVFLAEFNWEEANAFYVPTFFLDPLALLVEPWGGTFQVVTRLGYQLLRAVPVGLAPLAENVLAMAALVAVATFVASRRMAAVVPDWRLRAAVALALLLLPAQGNVIGTFVNAQWYGALWMALVPLAVEPASAAGRWVERAAVALMAVTGPFSTLLAPVYLWRLHDHRTRHARWLAAIVLSGGLIQAVSVFLAGRADTDGERSALFGAVTLALHTAVIPVLGERLASVIGAVGHPGLLFVAGGLVAIAAAICVGQVLGRRTAPFLYAAVVVAISGVAVHSESGIWPPGANERYFLLAAAAVTSAIVIGAAQRRPLALLLLGILGFGILADFRLSPYPPQGWETTQACIGAVEPCVIPIWTHDYDVQWPGVDGDYVMPEHYDP